MTFAMPTKATPRVPAVVHELPVIIPTTAHTRAAATKNQFALRMPMPR